MRSNKITRRNSVKEISQKFIDNAVDILKSERQTSYPKAGLILRTSSFKDSRTGDSKQCRRGSSGGETTFLTNKSRVTGVQDVIDRMKTEEYREGDSAEDAEARSLLNKFIGSQVILSGMESRVMSSSTSTKGAITSDSGKGLKRTSKITITVTDNNSVDTVETEASEESDSYSNKRAKSVVSVTAGSRNKKNKLEAEDEAYSRAMNILQKPVDMHQIYGDHVALELRAMSKLNCKRAKLEISKILIKYAEAELPQINSTVDAQVESQTLPSSETLFSIIFPNEAEDDANVE
nr:unnamed protein product [Callosobruchus analis]